MILQPSTAQSSSRRLREATKEDIPEVVAIHSQVFPNTVMTQLGRNYLKDYYRKVLSFRGGIILVAEIDGVLMGFASGLIQPELFYRTIVKTGWKTVGYVLKGVFLKPRLLSVIPYSIARVFRSTPRTNQENTCEMSFIAMLPEAAGKGVGKELAIEFVKHSRERGATVVKLTTHAESNEATNNFYTSLGFTIHRTFRQCHGCLTNEYVFPTSIPRSSGL